MNERYKSWFEWISKHWSVLKWVFGAFITFIAIYIWPLLLIKVWVPVWLIILMIIIPVVIYYQLAKYMNEKKIPKSFANGDRVYLKGTYKSLFIISYDWLSHTIVYCADENGKRFTYHQDSLEYPESRGNYPTSFLSNRRNDRNRY